MMQDKVHRWPVMNTILSLTCLQDIPSPDQLVTRYMCPTVHPCAAISVSQWTRLTIHTDRWATMMLRTGTDLGSNLNTESPYRKMWVFHGPPANMPHIYLEMLTRRYPHITVMCNMKCSGHRPSKGCSSYVHPTVCLTKGPQPLLERIVPTVRSRALCVSLQHPLVPQGHSVAAYVFFLVFPPLPSFPLSSIQ